MKGKSLFRKLMTGVSGIRGVVGEGMTPEVALLWSGGFGTWVKGRKVVVARDARPSGVMLEHAVLAGLSAAGCDVDLIGMTPTPTAALAVKRRGAAGGIIITASHNPQEWNALKLVRPDGRMLTAEDFAEVQHIVIEGPLRSAGWDKLGGIRHWDGAELSYVSAVTGMSFLDLTRIQSKHLKVAFDGVNGAGSRLYPQLLEALGCEVISIHCEGNGRFPRGPEPLPEHLTALSRVVVENKCAIGFAVDPDGDRLAAVDERGLPIGEETTLALVIKTVLSHTPGPVVVNTLTTQAVDDVAGQFNVICHRTRVGEANVSARIVETGAVVGGEGNGGVIIPEVHLVRDAGAGMALLVNLLCSGKTPLSEHTKALPSYKMVKKAVPLGESDPNDIIESLTRKYPFDQISRIDGMKVSFSDGWVQARASNTEPIIRVFAEAVSEDRAKSLVDELLSHLKEINKHPL